MGPAPPNQGSWPNRPLFFIRPPQPARPPHRIRCNRSYCFWLWIAGGFDVVRVQPHHEDCQSAIDRQRESAPHDQFGIKCFRRHRAPVHVEDRQQRLAGGRLGALRPRVPDAAIIQTDQSHYGSAIGYNHHDQELARTRIGPFTEPLCPISRQDMLSNWIKPSARKIPIYVRATMGSTPEMPW